MSYYKILGFEKEPFSTSPDPDFFFFTQGHQSALTNILIELRLRRGLSVILGDVGTGKTTLSRKLIRALKERGDFVAHCVMDPCYENEYTFLSSLVRGYGINLEHYRTVYPGMEQGTTMLDLKEALEKYLYEKCIVQNKTVVLIVDEAQKLTEASMEMLRVILNYETNENKLLQLILLGQLELHSKILAIPNFMDRISFKYTLNPLGFAEAKDMILFRVKQAGYNGNARLFLDEAIHTIHTISRGYPRKITLLCHRALKNLVMRQKWVVDEAVVREIVDEDVRSGWLTQTSL